MKTNAISFGDAKMIRLPKPDFSKERSEEDKKTVKYTAEAGTAGFGVVAARNYAQRKGIIGNMVANTTQKVAGAARTASRAARVANKNAKEASGLLARFFKNSKIFAQDILARIAKFKNNKYLKPIIESPVTKKAAGFLGGVFAFFVLVTGINESVRNGKLMIDDAKSQISQYRNAA